MISNWSKTFASLILAAALVIAALIVTRTSFVIKNISGTSQGELTNTIHVTGNGLVYGKPDMALLYTTVSVTAPTSSQAQAQVNQKIAQIKEIAKQQGVADEDIKTTRISLQPRYEYRDRRSVYVGQEAIQSLEIKIKGIDEKASRAGKIIDQIVQIPDVRLDSIRFDMEDKQPFFSQARKKAFEKARQKAEELAKLGGVRLLKPVYISDVSRDIAFAPGSPPDKLALPVAGGGGATELSTGELTVEVTLTVNFEIQ